MSEKKPSRDSNSRPEEIIDNIKENSIRAVDEIAKAQASEVQQLSELQKEAAEISKNVVIATTDNQKQNAAADSNAAPIPAPVSGQVMINRSNELADNFVNFTWTYNKLAINALDAARENARLCSKTMDAITSHNLNLLNTWISYWTAQPQQWFSKE